MLGFRTAIGLIAELFGRPEQIHIAGEPIRDTGRIDVDAEHEPMGTERARDKRRRKDGRAEPGKAA
jgi:hypothetical protein